MTSRGTFVVNGIERVVVNQMHRSPEFSWPWQRKGHSVVNLYLIVYNSRRGSWLDFEYDIKDICTLESIEKRKFLYHVINGSRLFARWDFKLISW